MVTVPRDSNEEARVYLRSWLELREGSGIARTRKMILIFQLLSAAAGGSLVAGVLFGWHDALIALSGILLGYARAVSASLKSQLRTWPHKEQFLNWDGIQEAIEAE